MGLLIEDFEDNPYEVPVSALVPLFGLMSDTGTLQQASEATVKRTMQAILDIAPNILLKDFTLKSGGMSPTLRR